MRDACTAKVEVTSFHPGHLGGGVIIGQEAGREIRALVKAAALPREPRDGETWRVTGTAEVITVLDHRTGGMVAKSHIVAQVAMPLAPSGAGIRRWIARNRNIPGVGEAYADRLWNALGPSLYDHLRDREVAPLAAVLDVVKAHAIVDAWALLTDEVTAIEELDNLGVSGVTANAALRLFGAAAADRFRKDPYSLTLLEAWDVVDEAALAAGLQLDDPRRLAAAVDVAAAKAFRTTESHLGGHTVVTREMLRPRVRQMLGPHACHSTDRAIEEAVAFGRLRDLGGGRLQARGPWFMERQIEDATARRSRLAPICRAEVAMRAIAEVELEDGIVLAPEQAAAVRMAMSSGFSFISGGAGTGKSTVCKSILRAACRANQPRSRQRFGNLETETTCCMIAVSGRAARRLQEATGGHAMTVRRYLTSRENGRLWFERGLVIIDEVSMVGTPDLWRILSVTPPSASVLLVGDDAQLPPLRAGYPARAISVASSVPRTTLTDIHRQKASTGIPAMAAFIRAGQPPALPTFDFGRPDMPGVYFLPCPRHEVPALVTATFEAIAGPPVMRGDHEGLLRLHGADAQILCMTKAGPAGAIEIGDGVERRWLASWPPMHDWGLKVGSKILWTRNSYDRPRDQGLGDDEAGFDIMNGSLGIMRRSTFGHRPGAMVTFDGEDAEVQIDDSDLDRLVRGWAITVHKAQGSAFESVIIPVVPSRLLDRAMIYTAVTRARRTVVLVGDVGLFATAVRARPHAWHRMQALDPDKGLERLRAARTAGAPT